MSDKARYGISLAIGWSIGAVFLVTALAFGFYSSPWMGPVAFALTFGVTMAALNILKD